MLHYYDDDTALCTECPEAGSSAGILAAVTFGVLCIAALLSGIYHRPPRALQGTSSWLHTVSRFIEPLGLWPKLKQLISFTQILFSLDSVYRTSLPREFYQWLWWIRWLTLDVFDVLPVECFGDISSRLRAMAAGPLVVIAAMMVVAIALGGVLKMCMANALRGSITFGAAASLVIVWCFTPPVSKALFEVFDCQSFGLCAAEVSHHLRLCICLER